MSTSISRAIDGEILAERQPRAQRRLDVGHQQRRADALARHVADEQREVAVAEREVVEEVAADLARRDRHALDLRRAQAQRPVRQHVVLNLAAELQLAADALLLDHRVLMALDVFGHLVEGARQLADLVVRADLHPRAVVAFGDAVHAVVERREVAGQAGRTTARCR